MDKTFWRGTAQNYLGTIFATITVGIAAALIGWVPQLIHLHNGLRTFIAIFGTYLIGLLLYLIRRARRGTKLTIHSAVYGTGPENDRDVTEILQAHDRDAASFEVDNKSFGFDPAPMKMKRLEVEYSYGSRARFKVSRPEGSRLVLPVDSWMQEEIQRLARELEDTHKTTAALSQEPKQRLTIRILQGYFGVSPNSKDTQVLLLEVRVDGPAARIKGWRLNLERGGAAWKTAYQQPFGRANPIRLVPDLKGQVQNSLAHIFHEPFDPLVPGRGWLHFTVETADDRFSDLLWGATSILAAVEDQRGESSWKEIAGTWLHPAVILAYLTNAT